MDAKFVKSAAERRRDEYEYMFNRLEQLRTGLPPVPCESCHRKEQRYACTTCGRYKQWFSTAWAMVRRCYLGVKR